MSSEHVQIRQINVGNDALFVIVQHGSGDTICPRFLRDWEVAKVALSCRMALDMLCQELHTKSKGDVVGLVSERACRMSDKPL